MSHRTYQDRARECAARLVRAAEAAIGELPDGSPAAAKLDLALRLAHQAEHVTYCTGANAAPWDGIRDRDGESWTAWKVFPASTSDDDALEAVGFPGRYYGGPGRGFSNEPWLKRQGSRLLVIQTGGLDI